MIVLFLTFLYSVVMYSISVPILMGIHEEINYKWSSNKSLYNAVFGLVWLLSPILLLLIVLFAVCFTLLGNLGKTITGIK